MDWSRKGVWSPWDRSIDRIPSDGGGGRGRGRGWDPSFREGMGRVRVLVFWKDRVDGTGRDETSESLPSVPVPFFPKTQTGHPGVRVGCLTLWVRARNEPVGDPPPGSLFFWDGMGSSIQLVHHFPFPLGTLPGGGCVGRGEWDVRSTWWAWEGDACGRWRNETLFRAGTDEDGDERCPSTKTHESKTRGEEKPT